MLDLAVLAIATPNQPGVVLLLTSSAHDVRDMH